MKPFKIIFLLALLNLLFAIFSNIANTTAFTEFSLDINNDGVLDKVVITPGYTITLFNGKNGEARARFVSKAVNIFQFKQFDSSDYNEYPTILNDYSGAFCIKNNFNDIKYKSIHTNSSIDKFILADINNDGLLDFVRIETGDINHGGFYKQSIYYQIKGFRFPNSPSKIIYTEGSSWITGIYNDINNDGIPEKIDISYSSNNFLFAKVKCFINIYKLSTLKDQYEDVPISTIISTGVFDPNINFRDLDNNGYPDIILIDSTQIPASISNAISMIFGRKIPIELKIFLSIKGTYQQTPLKVRKLYIDPLKSINISVDSDVNSNGYRNIILNQGNSNTTLIFSKPLNTYIIKK